MRNWFLEFRKHFKNCLVVNVTNKNENTNAFLSIYFCQSFEEKHIRQARFREWAVPTFKNIMPNLIFRPN